MKRVKTSPVQVERVVEKVIEQKSEIVETEGGMITLLGKQVLFHCMNYNYTGKLIGVNLTCVELEDPSVVFETGSYNAKEIKLSEKLPNNLFINISTIEAFWEVK
jgi:hypothetical protein